MLGLGLACSPGRDLTPTPDGSAGSTELVRLEWGRLVDVYGYRGDGEGKILELVATDIVVGPQVVDERGNEPIPDQNIRFDYLSPDPTTLQPRLLIPRPVQSPEFEAIFADLDAEIRRVAPARFGQSSGPTPLVPRNAALRLTFSRPLGVDAEFFVAADESRPINRVAVQLLEIAGDPDAGGLQPVPHRVIYRGHQLILDPVLLGDEGLAQSVRNNASGLPVAPDQRSLNIRLALPLRGELAIPGLRVRTDFAAGVDARRDPAIVRDFRSGHPDDESSDLAGGYLRIDSPLRLLGEFGMRLARVDDLDDATQVLTLWKNSVLHELDLADGLRIYEPGAQDPAFHATVLAEPDDTGRPDAPYVRVRVARRPEFAALDPRRRSDHPPAGTDPGDWLRANAPVVVVSAPFEPERGDRIENFVRFAPEPLPLANGLPSPPNLNVSPFAGVVVRFTQPVDMRSVRPFDSFFLATRDVVTVPALTEFARERGLALSQLNRAKAMTPHLVNANLFDEDGSQTKLRLQPPLGLYLDDLMRGVDEGRPLADRRFNYVLHLIGGRDGIRDLAGNPLDLGQSAGRGTQAVLPFGLDMRRRANGTPLFADNRVVHIVRRYAHVDEDPRPSYHRLSEVDAGGPFRPEAASVPDVFGGIWLEAGKLAARPASRVSRYVDDSNQGPVPNDACPPGELIDPTTSRRFTQPLFNPFNPFGCRLQTVWREMDMDLSRRDPNDFDLDVEALFWCPFQGSPITFDEFDRASLFLGHSEYRPEPCRIGTFPSARDSGLKARFRDNYVNMRDAGGGLAEQPEPHAAFVDAIPWIDAGRAVFDPTSSIGYVPLPPFQEPYFIWRDQRSKQQGGVSGRGSDIGGFRPDPYIPSPFLAGRGSYARLVDGSPRIGGDRWDNRNNFETVGRRRELATGGLVGTIALPLLADFWMYPDSPELPVEQPFLASGLNGWQVSLPIGNNPNPAFRAYIAGGFVGGRPRTVEPDKADVALGGLQPNGTPTRALDNTFFWTRADFRKRVTVSTAGFVDLLDPHRVEQAMATDPRLGPFTTTGGLAVDFSLSMDPPTLAQPAGTHTAVEFRAAGVVDPMPWAQVAQTDPPTERNFPLDPFKAGDAHIRKRDVRNGRTWTHYYNWQITDYTQQIGDLTDREFLARFADPSGRFGPSDVRYFNWRLVFEAATETGATPELESLAISYRLRAR